MLIIAPLQKKILSAIGMKVSDLTAHILALIMERNCEQCHCAECMRPVFQLKTKDPSGPEAATVQCHHSAKPQAVWMPARSCSTHTAAVADKRPGEEEEELDDARDVTGPERGELGSEDGRG